MESSQEERNMVQKRAVYNNNLYHLNKTQGSDLIRLLRYQGLQRGRLVYELETFSLRDAPPYAALSYSWGSKSQTSAVILDNGAHCEVLEITEDLEDALQRVTLPDWSHAHPWESWSGWLWADQVCINQTDDMEKGDQVGRMKCIYSRAGYVFVWLGREMADDGYTGSIRDIPDGGLSRRKVRNLLEQGVHCWWNRLWVIQEIVSCNSIYVWVGWQAMKWESFLELFTWRMRRFSTDLDESRVLGYRPDMCKSLTDYKEALANASHRLGSLATLRCRLREEPDDLDLLDLFRYTPPSGVSNKLDRVYSLLGLATGDWQQNVPVKYGVSIGTVFAAVVKQSMRRSRSLDVLFDKWPRRLDTCGERVTPKHRTRPPLKRKVASSKLPTSHRPDLIASLPTWMPDFSQPLGHNSKTVTSTSDAHSCRAASFASLSVEITDNLELVVQSIALGPIDKLEQGTRADFTPSCCWHKKDHEDCPMGRACRRFFHRRSIATHIWLAFSSISRERKVYFKTRHHGFPGIGFDVEAGDEVIVPLGTGVPWVVRTQGMPDLMSGRYELVSDCYVEGVMEGQLEALVNSGKVTVKEYRIR